MWTGSYATNPLSGEQIPVWIADYVLMGYGTGAIMAVPSGDQRDFEFARKFGLSIPAIQRPSDAWFDARGIDPTTRHRRLARGVHRRRCVRQLLERHTRPERHRQQGRRHRRRQRVARADRTGRADDHVQAPRLAVQPSALLGRAVPGRLRRRRLPAHPARRDVAGRAARDRLVLAAHLRRGRRVLQPREPARPAGRLGHRHPRPGRRPAGNIAATPT